MQSECNLTATSCGNAEKRASQIVNMRFLNTPSDLHQKQVEQAQ